MLITCGLCGNETACSNVIHEYPSCKLVENINIYDLSPEKQ